MGGHRIKNQNELHYLTFTVVGWVDVFTRKDYKDILIESLKYCIDEKGLLLFAYLIGICGITLVALTKRRIRSRNIFINYQVPLNIIFLYYSYFMLKGVSTLFCSLI